MKTIAKLLAIASVFAASVTTTSAQNWTTVTASNITDLNQNKLAAGQLCFLVTDQNDNPISVNIGGGGQNLKRPYCSAVTTGAAAAFTVPNPASTNPSGVYYRVTVKDTSTGLEVLRYTLVTFTGGSFNFDNYAPQNVSAPAPLNNSVNGNFTVNGNESITGTSSAASYSATGADSAAAYNVSTHGDRQVIIQNSDFEGSSILVNGAPPGWSIARTPSAVVSYETVSPAPNKVQSLKISATSPGGTVLSSNKFQAVPGDTYTFTAMVKSDGVATGSAALTCWTTTPVALYPGFSFAGNVGSVSITTAMTSWTAVSGSGTIPAGTYFCTPFLAGGTGGSIWFDQISVQKTNFQAFSLINTLESATAPTISSGFGTSPSVTINNGTADFRINVGTGGTASSGVIGLPAAGNGWDCDCEDRTTFSTTVFKCRQTSDTTTSATISNFNSSAAAAAWAASDVVAVKCLAR